MVWVRILTTQSGWSGYKRSQEGIVDIHIFKIQISKHHDCLLVLYLWDLHQKQEEAVKTFISGKDASNCCGTCSLWQLCGYSSFNINCCSNKSPSGSHESMYMQSMKERKMLAFYVGEVDDGTETCIFGQVPAYLSVLNRFCSFFDSMTMMTCF